MLLTLAAFGMPLTVVLAGDGVTLLDTRAGHDTGLLAMLPGMGVEEVWLESGSGHAPRVPEQPALGREPIEIIEHAPRVPEQPVLPHRMATADDVRALLATASHTVNL